MPTAPPIMPDKYHTYNSPVVLTNVSNNFYAVMWSYPIPNGPVNPSTMYSYQMVGGSTWQNYQLPVTLYAASGGASIGSSVYSFGGSIPLNVDPVDSVYEIIIDNNGNYVTSTQCTSLPIALASVTAVTYGSVILLVGGYSKCVPAPLHSVSHACRVQWAMHHPPLPCRAVLCCVVVSWQATCHGRVRVRSLQGLLCRHVFASVSAACRAGRRGCGCDWQQDRGGWWHPQGRLR